MKESTLIEMKNKIEALAKVLRQTAEEQGHLITLVSGMFETIKLMPGYSDAIGLLTAKAASNKPKELEL